MRTSGDGGPSADRTELPVPTVQDLINVLGYFKANEECSDKRCRFCRATTLLKAVELHGVKELNER
jgi:hypothetical protein